MNSDDFEKRLERQAIRPIPGEWRQNILHKANAVSPSLKNHSLSWVIRSLWRELIWSSRRAWTGMAALWLVLWGINSALSSGEVQFAGNSASAPAMIERMEEQRQLLAELISPANSQPAEPPRRNHPQPRTELQTISIIG